MFLRSKVAAASLVSSAAIWSSGASTCFAHPDHPVQVVSSDSLLHYFVQPEHALPLAAFAVVVWLVRRLATAKFSGRVAG